MKHHLYPHPLFHALLTVLFISSALAEIRNDHWRWSNPLPHGNNVMDMKVSNEIGVQVGDAGTLYVQHSDERWAPVHTGINHYMRGTTLLGERIIVSGESGLILWSDDGKTFEPAQLTPPNTLDWFEGVAASAQRAVAVGDYGTIYTSTDGANWVLSPSDTTEWLRGAASGVGAFVAVGENGTILRSSANATSWTKQGAGLTTQHLNRVRFLGTSGTGAFYAVGNDGVVLNSADGNTWTLLNSGTTNDLFDVALNNSGLLVVGDQEMRVSLDGGASWEDQINDLNTNAAPAWVYLSAHGKSESWLVAGQTGLLMAGSSSNSSWSWAPSPSNSSHAWLWDMTVQNGIYIAVGDLAHIKTSLDGILWSQEVVPVSYSNTVWLGVGGTSNLLLTVGSEGHVAASAAGSVEMTVTNGAVVTNIIVEGYGVLWTNRPSFTTNSLQGVDAIDDLFIVTGDQGVIFTSSDSSNWTQQTSGTTEFISSVAIGADACVAVGKNGTLLRSEVDGTSWAMVPMDSTNWLYKVRWLENQFVVAGQNGSIFTSPDGSSWTPRDSGTTRWLTDITYGDGQWFICGYQGTLLTSTQLESWTTRPLPTGKSLFTAATRNGQLTLAGIEGITLRNQIVPLTDPVMLLDYTQSTSSDTNALDTVYELFLFGGESDQFFELQSCTNLIDGTWTNVNGVLEMFDASGTLYAIRTRDATNGPPAEYYRTRLLP